MSRRLKIAALGISLVVLLLGFLFLYSSAGLRLVLGAGKVLSQGQFTYTSFAGDLATGWSLVESGWKGKDSTIEVRRLQVEWKFWDLLRGQLNILSLEAEGVELISSEKNQGEEKENTPTSLGDISLPLNVVIHSARLSDLSFSDGTADTRKVEEITAELRAEKQKLDVKLFSIKGLGGAAQISGNIEMKDGWPLEVDGTWQYTANAGKTLNGTIKISDSLSSGKAVLTSAAPIEGELLLTFGIGETVSWRADLRGRKIEPSFFHTDFSGEINMQLEAMGKHGSGQTGVELQIGRLDGTLNNVPVEMSGKAKSDGSSISIDSLLLNAGKTKFSFTGTVGQDADVDFTLMSPDIGEIYPSFSGKMEGGGHIGGRLPEVRADMNLKGENLDLGDLTVESLSVMLSGFAGSGEGLEITIRSQGLSFQEKQFENLTFYATGDMQKHSMRAYFSHTDMQMEIEAEGAISDTGWGGQIMKIDGHHEGKGSFVLRNPVRLVVGSENYSLDDFCLDSNGGSLCLNGAFHREKWRAKMDLNNFDPELFFSGWPGTINAEIFIEGELSEKQRDIELEFARLDGTLRNIELYGSGTVKILNDDLTCDDFQLSYGKANLSANGKIGNEVEMVFHGAVPDLGQIYPGYEADLSFSGSISGERNKPKLRLEFKGKEGNLDGIRFASTKGKADIDLSMGGQVNLDVSAHEIIIGDFTISSAEIKGGGETNDHTIYVAAGSNLGDILVEGRGTYNPETVLWKGAFQTLDLNLQKYGEWRLKEKVLVEYGSEKGSLSDGCLESQIGAVCLDAELLQDGVWRMTSGVEQLSLLRLQQAGLLSLSVEGDIQGSLEASGKGTEISSLDGEVLVPLLQIVDREIGKSKDFQFKNNRLESSLDQGELKFNFLSSLAEGGEIKGKLFASRSTDGSLLSATSALRGDVSFDVDDLGFLSILTDGWLEPVGRMVGDLEIAGTVDDPQLKGNVAIPEGLVWIADLGISLEDLSVHLFNQEEKIGYEISGKSGPGMVTGNGQLVFDDQLGPLLTGQFSGDDFVIMATEEYYIRVNPKVELNLGGGVKSLTGKLTIPHAQLKWQAAEGGISPSADVVIVDEDGKEETANGKFVIDINIVAGDDVSIDAYGLQSKITGNLTLTDYPGKPMSALGELQVQDGKFALYSTELDIIRGRLYFSGGPVENPGVDFRAERKVEKKRVGVNVSGTAQEMEFNLYSDPFMGESDILAYMLVGSSMQTTTADDQGLIGSAATALGIKGVNTITSSLQQFIPIDEIYLDGSSSVEDMSLVLGKHITEDLFIGYDHNFFDNTGEFRAKYNLGWGFSVETARSVDSTSGDLFFSIER